MVPARCGACTKADGWRRHHLLWTPWWKASCRAGRYPRRTQDAAHPQSGWGIDEHQAAQCGYFNGMVETAGAGPQPELQRTARSAVIVICLQPKSLHPCCGDFGAVWRRREPEGAVSTCMSLANPRCESSAAAGAACWSRSIAHSLPAVLRLPAEQGVTPPCCCWTRKVDLFIAIAADLALPPPCGPLVLVPGELQFGTADHAEELDVALRSRCIPRRQLSRVIPDQGPTIKSASIPGQRQKPLRHRPPKPGASQAGSLALGELDVPRSVENRFSPPPTARRIGLMASCCEAVVT